jgi:hypothetical protein
MAKSKRGAAQRKKRATRSVNPRFVEALEVLADRDAMPPSGPVNRAIREMLEREGMWPWHGLELEALARKRGTSVAEQVRLAIEERLKSEGLLG